MSDLSNNQGRAFEYAMLRALEKEISKIRAVSVEENSSLKSALRALDAVTPQIRKTLITSANAAVEAIFDLEPIILDDGDDILELKIQSDQAGMGGDVRDVLIIRRGIDWEIGLSVKHNHFAVKHSRIGKKLDFGDKWYGVKCSSKYWSDVKPVFDMLEVEKKKGTKWSELPSKETTVYMPLLQAFVDEINRSYEVHGGKLARKLFEYLLGKYDFYKIIGIDNKKLTKVQAFNFRGTLNKQGIKKRTVILVPREKIPSRIVCLGIKPKSNNRAEMCLDGGWHFGLRIHNAKTLVECSLKFDVQIIGMPITIFTIDKIWSM